MTESEPSLETDPSLSPVLAELRAREPLFHRPEWGTTRADFERMISGDYWEVGASGKRYSRAFVLDVLQERWAQPHDDPWETADFHCRDLGGGVYALTYTLTQGPRVTRRLTLWQRTGDQWRALFHQGTVVA